MLNVLLTLGPIMIAFASIPGLTQGYLAAWLLGLIEVTAWGITAKIFLSMLIASEKVTTVNPNLTQNLAEHIVFNLVYSVSFLVIPVATATILRGGAAGIAQTALGSAKRAAMAGSAAMTGGASAVGKKMQAAMPGGGGGGDRDREPSAGPQTSPTVERAGDRTDNDAQSRRDAFARDGAIRKQERGRSDQSEKA